MSPAEALPPWPEILSQLKDVLNSSRLSEREAARQIEISHAGLRKLLSEETGTPYQSTQKKVWGWIQGWRQAWVDEGEGDQGSELRGPEEELLEYFLEHHPEMATFLSTTTDGLSAEDRRMVAVAIFNGFKKLAIQAGERLPDWFFDLERRFVQGAE